MIYLPWRVSGARLQLPRDLEIAYAVGRMGIVTVADAYPLWYGSRHTARFGFGRLARLGLIRSFPRESPLSPAWFSLTPRGLEWAAEKAGCDERELRAVAGIRRANLAAASMRNCFWVSAVLACRRNPGIRIGVFRPEWEIRQMKPETVSVVPDALVSFIATDETVERERAWILEMDAGTQRSAVWRAKARHYADLRGAGRLYGVVDWWLLAIVPSVKRARTVAVAITAGGAGAFSFVGVASGLDEGRAFDKVLWSCLELAKLASVAPRGSIIDGLGSPISEPDRQSQSTADRDSPSETGAISP
jgi:hypothetical protein